jgi:hypothetical protein
MARLVPPENKTPCIPSAGFDMMKATKHEFVGVEPFAIKYATSTYRAHGMMYKCTETGAIRRWGYQ